MRGYASVLRCLGAALLVALAGAALAQTPAAAPSASERCQPQPFGQRDLYLRGTFNGWSTVEAQRFRYHCNRYELVTVLQGVHRFKIGDEDWSADTDFGVTPVDAGPPWRLTAKARDMQYPFQGTHRLILSMSSTNIPTLGIESCPATPLGETALFLRGTMNNWAALDDYGFRRGCDGYYLNVKLQGRHEFKIADAAWVQSATLGGERGEQATALAEKTLPLGTGNAGGAGNVAFDFRGEHTIRVAFDGIRPSLRIGPKSHPDADDKAVSDPVALSLRFDSRESAAKSPFGATTPGAPVEFAVTGLAGIGAVTLVVEKRLMEGNQERLEYTEVARVPLIREEQSTPASQIRWRGRYTFRDVSVYGYYFEAKVGDKVFVYQNNRDSVYWTREKGSNGLGRVEEAPAARKNIRRFRHTVYAADFNVPAWARDAVYYYIFPERFRNGNPANDPRPGVHRYHDKTVEFHRNWLDKPYKPGSGDGSDDTFNNDFFGGDLAGIIEKLDYIAALGANVIYMTPVFHAASNHKYDTADYKNIDPRFGGNADFVKLTAEAAKRGIRVIPDASLNHTGSDSVYFDRFANFKTKGAFEGGKIQADSPYASWYRFDPSQTDPNKQYKGWVDVADLPELDKSSPGFRRFAYGAPDSVMKLWLDRGAAGWRMDVAPWVPDDFWREWRAAIKQHRPDALTIAETWFDASKYFLGDSFDSTMNYIFRGAVLDYAKGGRATQAYQPLELIREVYPPQSLYALMNLVSSHDVARTLHVFGYHDGATDAAIGEAKQRLRLATFFQMIYPGAPSIYYGDEVGLSGGDDPYNRATYPWPDKGGKPDTALLADFKRLIKLRKDHPVLRRGTLGAPLLLDDHLIVLARQDGDTWALTATNNATVTKAVRVKLPAAVKAAGFVDTLSGAPVKVDAGFLAFDVPALYGTVLVSR